MKQRRFTRGWRVAGAGLCLAAALTAFAGQPFKAETGEGGAQGRLPVAAPKHLKIDLNKAVKVSLPKGLGDLKPAPFRTADGKSGWVVKMPGGRPIATPAYADGLLFVGGGYGSHEFYAFDAKTGRMVWKINAGDDGPTAAVVEDGLVAFNTESCTLVVVEAKTGKLVWQEWLGDPLMSQPAISKGRVYMAYPAGQRGHASRLRNNLTKQGQQEETPREVGSHRLLCADLRTGKHIWERAISSDVISAPVVSEGKVYFTTFDGTSYSLDAMSGGVVWKKENAGTSAPVVVKGEVLMTQKEERDADSYEGLKVLNADKGDDRDARLLARSPAKYLGEDKGGGVALKDEAQASLDSSVGFGSAPAAAGLSKANRHVGVRTVVGGWAYQGSRAAYSKGRMVNAQGRYLNSINAADGGFAWRAEVGGEGVSADGQVFSPPALGEQFMYLSGALGHLVSVEQKDGGVGFMYHFGSPMVFQPALAEGNVYVGTADGHLICLKTGSPDAEGWHAWGGNAEHNKNR